MTSPRCPTDPSSVATPASRSRAAPSAWSASRKPSSVTGGSPPPSASRIASWRIARGAVPTPPPTRTGARSLGSEAGPQRPGQPELVAGLELAQPACARPDILEHELEHAVPRPQDRQRPRQERPLAVAGAPPLRRREHVELARLRRVRVPGRVVDREHDVRADRTPCENDSPPPTERRRGPLAPPADQLTPDPCS